MREKSWYKKGEYIIFVDWEQEYAAVESLCIVNDDFDWDEKLKESGISTTPEFYDREFYDWLIEKMLIKEIDFKDYWFMGRYRDKKEN